MSGTGLLLVAALAGAPEPAAWPAPWGELLGQHFGTPAPVRIPQAQLEEEISLWLAERPTPLEILQRPVWRTDQVLLLDAESCAKVAARVRLHSVFPFSGKDERGHPFRIRAALFGRKKFAFVYDAPVEFALPEYAVYGSDHYGVGALNLGELGAHGIFGFRAFDEKGKPREVKGPAGASLTGLTQEGERIRAAVKVFPDATVKTVKVEPSAP